MCLILLSRSSMKWKYWCVSLHTYEYKWRWGEGILWPLLLLSHSVMSNSLWPHGLQHTRLPCSFPSPGACSNSCTLNRWDHPTHSSSVVPFSSCPPSFPPLVLFFQWVSSLHQVAKVLEFELQHQSFQWIIRIDFLYNWLVWSLYSPRNSKSFFQHHSLKASILWHSAFFMVQLSHPYMITGKAIALTIWTFLSKVMSLLLNMLSRLVITFLPRSKRLLISWLQSPSAVILEPKKIKSVTHYRRAC